MPTRKPARLKHRPPPTAGSWCRENAEQLTTRTALARAAVICVTGVVCLTAPASVFAQGNGRAGGTWTPPGLAKKAATPGPTTSTIPAESPTATGNRLQTFGSWLDTAYVSAPGETWMWVSSAYWRSPSLREIDAPAIGASVGIAPRTQIGVSLPYYHLTDSFGFTSHGFGASYATLKVVVLRGRRLNVSTSPTLEILNWSSPQIGRVNAVLPVSLQTDVGRARFYGSTGYFTRGSVFGSGAAEWSLANRVTLTTTVAHSYSVVSDPISDALGVSRHRTDGSGGMYLLLRPTLVLFASVGRTLSPVTETSGRLSVAGGLTINISGPTTQTPRNP